MGRDLSLNDHYAEKAKMSIFGPIFVARVMGKTNNSVCEPGVANSATRLSEESDIDLLKTGARRVGTWQMKVGSLADKSYEQQVQAKSRALKDLTNDPVAQRELIKIAQQATEIIDRTSGSRNPDDRRAYNMARQVNDRARELIILCHSGMIEKDITNRTHLLRGESLTDARAVLRQEAWAAIHKAIDTYQFDTGANPLTYFRQGQIRNFLSKAIEREGGEAGIRLKSKANELGKKVDEVANLIENEDRPATVAEIAERLGESPEKVAEVLPVAHGRAIRMDAPLKTDEGAMTFGQMIVDDQTDIETETISADASERIKKAISEIKSPLRRRLLEMTYGLEGDEVEQKDVFDGVYVDAQGRAYSAEATIISDRRERGVKVEKKAQSDLNKKFAAGELKFEPGTPEAYEIARLAKGDFNPQERFEKYITEETGLPPTSGTVYEAKRRAEQEVRHSPHLRDLVEVYRGDNELENSESARERVRQELLNRGVINDVNDNTLHSLRSRDGGKSRLRQLAEQHGLVDNRGRVTVQ